MVHFRLVRARRRVRLRQPVRLLLGLLALPLAPVFAQQAGRPGASWIELGASAHDVSGGFGDWYGGYLRSAITAGTRDVWFLEARWQEAFRDRGGYGAVANTHVLSPDWYTHLSLGGGTGRFHFPDLRADAALHRKWLPRRQLVTFLGATFVRSKDVYRDVAAFGGLTAYLSGWVIAEVGGRLNWSDPGAERSHRAYGVITLGRDRQVYLTLRAGTGTESYQLVGSTRVLRSFTSHEASLAWRQWLGARWGTQTAVEWYENPSYTRVGGSFGLFRHW